MRKFTMLCVAFAFAAAATGAHALKLVPTAAGNPATEGMSSVTYAKETLLKTATVVAGGTTYYTLARDHYVSAPTTVYSADANDAYVISFTLDGMVFTEAPMLNAPLNPGTVMFQAILGGFPGADNVVFQRTGTGTILRVGDPLADPVLTMTAKFAISGDGSGSITRIVQNRALANLGLTAWTETEILSDGVRAKPALVETAKPAGEEITASASYNFVQFRPGSRATPNLSVSVGSVELSVVGADDDVAFAKQYRDAQSVQTGGEDSVVDVIAEVTGADEAETVQNNTVTFSGNFSFVKMVGLTTTAPKDATPEGTCVAANELRKPSTVDPSVLTDVTIPQLAAIFENTATVDEADTAPQYLCIAVDGSTEIPTTTPYMVTTKYAGIPDAAFPPEGDTYDLSQIGRDGTTYYIPFLTTYEGYNQRISIVNRGRATTYSFTGLQTEAPTTAVWDEMASSGPLPTGQTVLKTPDIVEITDGNRAAGNLTIVASPGDVSAAVQLVNKGTGAIDNVYLQNMLR
jgi:hypothetical protein